MWMLHWITLKSSNNACGVEFLRNGIVCNQLHKHLAFCHIMTLILIVNFVQKLAFLFFHHFFIFSGIFSFFQEMPQMLSSKAQTCFTRVVFQVESPSWHVKCSRAQTLCLFNVCQFIQIQCTDFNYSLMIDCFSAYSRFDDIRSISLQFMYWSSQIKYQF